MRRCRFAFTIVCAAALAFTAPASAAAVPAAEHDPVIFVHGWNGSSWNWDAMKADFENNGYSSDELHAWDYDTAQSNEITAEEFAGYVDEVLASTGASQVDVVTHSMGGLNTRWYLSFLDGTSKVDDWVSLGGPNHGTTSAEGCGDDSCADMRPGSEFLTQLNEGDETPGDTSYATWWSPCDGVVYPAESTVLDGAENTELACVSHLGLLANHEVMEGVRAFVA
ncbi:alpha/beta fold hydrolase [Allosaccharopolyspora coralli]|uniref:Alpha/beta fold hydrolase n=1 Tax=Allosaccharopolyspora coralli TaxID=2665642 RepID=A0A5Q3Q7Z0_9PSEU|nr:triacylglycerol lipase [Allosaccharopolyspora coralli]QGK70602.1 alpha/beta fold hydrolase [Allosaccharopolyspora coralli]